MSRRTSYEAYDHFTLRAPVMPLAFLQNIPHQPSEIRPFLGIIWDNPVIRGGIELASPELYRLLNSELKDPKTSESQPRLFLSMLRYLTRFSSRCTPFGIFAGFATGQISGETNLKLTSAEGHRVHVRPDMEFLMRLARKLVQDPDVCAELFFIPNSTIYQVGSRWHYIETKFLPPNNKKVYDVVRIDNNGIISNILKFCRDGKTIEEIITHLVEEGLERSQVVPFLDSLVESQVIVSELEPVVCGMEYFDYLVQLVSERIGKGNYAGILIRLLETLDCISTPAQLAGGKAAVMAELQNLPLPVPEVHLIQADMKLGWEELTINRNLANQLLLGARILRVLSAQDRVDALVGFKEAFQKRFGENEVSLVRVLDPESGIGLDGAGEQYWTDPVPWIDDLRTGQPISSETTVGSGGNRFLLGRFLDATRNGDLYIEINPTDLAGMDLHAGEWPVQITLMAELFLEEDKPGISVHLIHAISGNPSYLLGRFAFADEGSTAEFIRNMINDEEEANPGAILAEVVHLPEDRTGNVLQRPSILKYEIPYLARSLKEEVMQIPISDLTVSIRNNRAILRSARLGKEIIPKMTNAYNHSLGHLSIYKFLHRVQHQKGHSSWNPDWGDTIRKAPFIPGIRYKNMILTAPLWTIRTEILSAWISSDQAQVDHQEILNWKISMQMPDEVLWISGDQELYINWTRPSLILAAWEVIRPYKLIRVRPFYFTGGSPVCGSGSSHANQFLFCYHQS